MPHKRGLIPGIAGLLGKAEPITRALKHLRPGHVNHPFPPRQIEP